MRPGKYGMRRGRRNFHGHEPLVRQHRLDDFPGAAAARHDHPVRLLADDEAERREIRQHRLARRVAVESAVLFGRVGVDRRVEVQDGNRRQIVALPHIPVVEVVRRRDLDAAGAERLVDIGIGNDGNRAAGERQRDCLPDQGRIAFVVRIDRDRDVAQHRLGSRRRDDDVAPAAQRPDSGSPRSFPAPRRSRLRGPKPPCRASGPS